ncbi:unnamed protein product [Bemisia tabaci]|uniref:Another transcription unit protein n=1 Tax=Bemisia tabaci TaxID=7038 RepID=A0A9P0F3G7_BEMTA|nr:unnamed protein product [Bemisia tabaci]
MSGQSDSDADEPRRRQHSDTNDSANSGSGVESGSDNGSARSKSAGSEAGSARSGGSGGSRRSRGSRKYVRRKTSDGDSDSGSASGRESVKSKGSGRSKSPLSDAGSDKSRTSVRSRSPLSDAGSVKSRASVRSKSPGSDADSVKSRASVRSRSPDSDGGSVKSRASVRSRSPESDAGSVKSRASVRSRSPTSDAGSVKSRASVHSKSPGSDADSVKSRASVRSKSPMSDAGSVNSKTSIRTKSPESDGGSSKSGGSAGSRRSGSSKKSAKRKTLKIDDDSDGSVKSKDSKKSSGSVGSRKSRRESSEQKGSGSEAESSKEEKGVTAEALFGDADDLSSDDSDKSERAKSRASDVENEDARSNAGEDEVRPSGDEGDFDGERSPGKVGIQEDEEEAEEPVETRIDVDLPKLNCDLGNDLHFVKLPNFLSVETRPFDSKYYEDEIDEEETLDEEGRARLKLKVENTIRWREIFDKDQNLSKESNAKFVTWSDGSMSLYLGSEIFDVYKQPLQGDHNHLFVRQGTGLAGQAIFKTKLTFRPHSTESFTHRKMTLSLADRSQKTSGVKMLSLVGHDPEHNRDELIKKEEERLRASLRRESKQKRVKERGASRGLSASYLEPDREDGSDDENAISVSAIKNKFKQKALNTRNIYSSDEDGSDLEVSSSKKHDKAKIVFSDDDDEKSSAGSASGSDDEKSAGSKTSEEENDD